MIKLTDAAAKQIKQSITDTNVAPHPLRFAVTKNKDGAFQYLMGFDEQSAPMDTSINVKGVDIIVSFDNKPLLDGMTVDYVDFEGEMRFIFQNPNDPQHAIGK